MDIVVPQDVARTVERCLVVVLAGVVRLRQIIVVGRTVVAIVDDDVVRIAIDERRVGRHVARIFLDRAIDRLDALAADREVGLLDRRAVVEREGARVLKTVVLLVLFAEAVECDHRVIGILGCILGDDTFRVARQCARTRDRQLTRTVTIDAREDCLAEICFRAVDRRIRCVRDEVVDVVFRDVQRRDVDIVHAIIVDLVVPQDVAITVERRLVVVLADVVGRLQIIAVGLTVVAIVDDNVVRIAINERRVGRHVARSQPDRAIDRVNTLTIDREVGLINIDFANFIIYYIVIFRGVKPRSRNRVCSSIIRITMTFIIRRNGAICI